MLAADGVRREWEVRGPFFPGLEVYHLDASTADPNRIWAAPSSGWFSQQIHRSDDGGQLAADGQRLRLHRRTRHPPVVRRHPAPVGVRPGVEPGACRRRPGHRAGRGEDAALLRSIDGGRTWAELPGLARARHGADDNRSWNCGAEGPTDDEAVRTLRTRQQRALLTTLMLSFGVPMLLGGDELGRTQRGNNNAYCQDGELTWFDWAHIDEELLAFTRTLIAFRLAHPVFRRRRFLSGMDRSMLRWFTPAGTVVTAQQWADPGARSVAIHLEGQDAPDHAADGSPLLDDDFLVLVNAWWQPLEFMLPTTCAGQQWVAEIDTFDPSATTAHGKRHAGDRVTAGPRSVVVLRGTDDAEEPR